jgi:superfamily II DNA or RNA helicase
MSVIRVLNHNSVHVKVSCEAGIAREIQEFFTFDVPGARFMPAYRNKMWDGKLRLFTPFNPVLYAGLLDHLAEFARGREYTLEVSPELVEKGDSLTKDDVSLFLSSLDLKAAGKPIMAYDHQIDALSTAMNRERCLLLSPTASGKSLIIYCLIRFWLDTIQPHRKVLVIVPTISLVSQMLSDFKDYSTANGWDVTTMCHGIFGGEEKVTDSRVVVSTWQSIYKLPKSYFDQFEAVIGDEAHLFKAQSLTGIMSKLVDCPYRVALTGTLDGTKTHRLVIEGLFGPMFKVTTTRDLMDKNLLSSLEIECLLLTYPDEDCKLMKDFTYQDEIDWLVSDPRRNDMIVKLAISAKGNTLVLFQFVEKHGKPLFKAIEKSTNRKVFYVSGETEADIREEIRVITESEDNAIIVASYGTFSTGINIRSLRNIVFASPSKSRIRVLQSIGRQLRKSDRKDKARLYDVADDLHWKSQKNHTLKHFIERVRIYSEEQFSYRMVKLPIKEQRC